MPPNRGGPHLVRCRSDVVLGVDIVGAAAVFIDERGTAGDFDVIAVMLLRVMQEVLLQLGHVPPALKDVLK
jgi:hypothetical protein